MFYLCEMFTFLLKSTAKINITLLTKTKNISYWKKGIRNITEDLALDKLTYIPPSRVPLSHASAL